MRSNKRAFIVLFFLVFASVIIFCAERKFLVSEPRGTALSLYKDVPWINKVLLLTEDFEGFKSDSSALPKDVFFSFGSAKISLSNSAGDKSPVSLKSALQVEWTGTENYGGWGKGIGSNIDLDTVTDYLNFRIYVPTGDSAGNEIKVMLEEDDNDDGKLQKDKDDAWCYIVSVPAKDQWQMISIPLKYFKDDNEGGDHKFNVTRKGGLHTILFGFQRTDKYPMGKKWFFDFICFSRGKI